MRIRCQPSLKGGKDSFRMARFKLTVAKLKSLPAGKQSDGDGLWIYKSVTSGSWVYRYTIAGCRRKAGLGSYPDVSLAQAREKAEASRQTRAKGRDSLTERVLEKNRNRNTRVAGFRLCDYMSCQNWDTGSLRI